MFKVKVNVRFNVKPNFFFKAYGYDNGFCFR